jgi:hypothetical protein
VKVSTERVKKTVVGKLAGALWRRRRFPRVVLRSEQTRRRESRRGPSMSAPPGSSSTLFIVPVGPKQAAELSDTLASIRRYEPAADVVVLSDGAYDIGQELVDDAFPGARLWRAPRLSGGPPRLSPPLLWAYRRALGEFPFRILCKLDTDALLTGSGLFERARASFEEDPNLGLLGSTAVRADGVPSDLCYSAEVLAHERRWSRIVRETLEAAERRGWDGAEAHGGVYLVSRIALERLADSGFLRSTPPWWSLLGEDLWLALGVAGAGYGIGSYGAPGEPLASGQGFLPIAKEDVLDRGVLAIHSVRRGVAGEDEAELRAFFRSARRRVPTSRTQDRIA